MEKLWQFLLALVVSTALSRAQTSAPRLSRRLSESYIINPAAQTRLRLCRFDGQPTPNVTWTVDGNNLPTSSDSGGVYYLVGNGTLILESAGSSDDGLYECTGTNVHGRASGRTQITFNRPSVRWYIDWYMWFIYSLVVWSLTIPVFIIWFFYKKKRADAELPPANPWIGN